MPIQTTIQVVNSLAYLSESQKNDNDMRQNTQDYEEKGNIDNDMDKFKEIIRDYVLSEAKPRDFNADLPILSSLGAENYD